MYGDFSMRLGPVGPLSPGPWGSPAAAACPVWEENDRHCLFDSDVGHSIGDSAANELQFITSYSNTLITAIPVTFTSAGSPLLGVSHQVQCAVQTHPIINNTTPPNLAPFAHPYSCCTTYQLSETMLAALNHVNCHAPDQACHSLPTLQSFPLLISRTF